MKYKKAIILSVVTIMVALWMGSGLIAQGDRSVITAHMPVQFGGRIKSFDTFSREIMQQITTRSRWEKQPASVFMLDVLSGRRHILEEEIVRMDHPKLKEMLGVDTERKYFSYVELKSHFGTINLLVDSAQRKRDADLRPTMVEQKAEKIYGRLITVDQLFGGDLLLTIPPDSGETWLSPYSQNNEKAKLFTQMMGAYGEGRIEEWKTLATAWNTRVFGGLSTTVQQQIRMENYYYRIHPFLYTWICYLVGFLLLMFGKKSITQSIAVGFILFGLFAQTVGLALRTAILARPPVSNMYESMIFMDWILIISALVFYAAKRNTFLLTTGALVSALVMIYADLLPVSKSLDVLMPVLRSNYWLIIHVMTIVASYGLFGLCTAVGHRHMYMEVRGKFNDRQRKDSSKAIIRLMQVGLILLGAGTILGGVWANESWGRFWGWDPKETWSLITFVGYMTVIHLWYAGKIDRFWLAVTAVLGFLLVLMTWYGVNFILGRGLHSYGSGSGGLMWIVYYLIFEVLFFAYIFMKRYGGGKAKLSQVL